MPIAFIFPGQGSQYAGMGKDLVQNCPAAQKVFEEADDALRFSISSLCFEGSAEELQLTENTQPAILTVSIAALRAIEAEGGSRPDYVAGHSLGEYSALVAAGALSLADALRTVRARGCYMQEAVAVGSAIMAPQVFEKSLSCVHNVRFQEDRPPVSNHSIYVVDLQDGGNWDWSQGEPPKTNPAYYLRFCKSFARMGGEMHYVQADNVLFLHNLLHRLS